MPQPAKTLRHPLRVLFLCTGNSCRSQMAEGWARHLKGGVIEPYSAGIDPHGLDPRAVQVMAEADVDISGQRSKHVDELKDIRFDYVVTVCDHAHEHCPLFPGRTKVLHAGFDDPPRVAAKAKTEPEALDCYRRVRDQIRAFVQGMPENLSTETPTNGGSTMSTSDLDKDVRNVVRKEYGKIAQQGGSCCGQSSCCGGPPAASVAEAVGYDQAQLKDLPEGANMGLSCGNPTALASLREGEVVLDLGAGAGLDVFIAAKKVGHKGRAIGVDMTAEMVTKARAGIEAFQRKTGLRNVEFRLGEIEHLPIADASVDVVISNCVINLSPDKAQVWREIARVLKPGGRVAVSDLALLRPLPEEIRQSVQALIGCVAGAVLVDETKAMVQAAGLTDAVFEAKSQYVDSMASWSDPLYRDIAAKVPAGTRPSDYVTSLSIAATKPGQALTPNLKELIAVGASVTAHCQPCLTYHAAKAREMGIGDQEIREAVGVGQQVEKGSMSAMREFTKGLLDLPAQDAPACCNGGTQKGQ